MLGGKHILLVISGGVAAYKCLELIRMIKRAGAQVTPVMTAAAAQFVTPLSVGALAGSKVYDALFDLDDEAEMGHIQLSRKADLVVVAPATADLMARMAGGHADDLATTLLMATDKAVLIAPAMNVRMWEHPATRRNLAILREDGVHVVGPETGDMACGEYGPGRMAEPQQIFDAIAGYFSGQNPMATPGAPGMSGILQGRRVLVTAGPTHEPLDPVRYLANRSSGTQGLAIAAALRDLGAHVVLVCGPVGLPMPEGVETVQVETAREMLAAVQSALPVEAAVFAAAVADWRARDPGRKKIKKDATGAPPALMLTENPDILATVSALGPGQRPALVVGFAAETDDVVANAIAKRARKRCDWIVANDVSPETGIMGGHENAVTLITDEGAEKWQRASKQAVAEKLAKRIASALALEGVA